MKDFIKYMLVSAAILLGTMASALAEPFYELNISWTQPTLRVNGDPLPASELDHYTVRVQHPDGTTTYHDVSGATNTNYVLPINASGEYVVWVNAVDITNVSSDYSTSDSKTVGIQISPPTGVIIEVTCAPDSTCTYNFQGSVGDF